MKKGFVFDLDGVITDTAKYHYIAWKELAAEIGIEIDLKFNEQLKGISRMDSLERILTLGNKNDAYTEVEKEALATKKNTHYVQLLQSLTPDDLLPGVKTFLDEAKFLVRSIRHPKMRRLFWTNLGSCKTLIRSLTQQP